MSPPLTHAQLLEALARGVQVVLPNPRATRTLRAAFDDRQRSSGAAAWDAAPALSWADWTRSLWSGLVADGAELRLLLNPAQEHALWREVIEAANSESRLSTPDSLADFARGAWQLASSFRAVSRLRSTATTYDSRTFAKWAESFARLLAEQICLPPAQLEDALREHVRSGSLRLEGPVLLAGFSTFTPAQTALLDDLRNSPVDLQVADLATDPSAVLWRSHAVAPSPRDELSLAAHWIRSLFYAPQASSTPPRVAVLLPDPDDIRDELESVFREVFAPELQPITADPSSAPWDFTAGRSLASHPMVVDALDLLRWTDRPLPLERISALLRSPFLGAELDPGAISRFDVRSLRRDCGVLPELDLPAVARMTQTLSGRHPRIPVPWLEALAATLRLSLKSSAVRSFADWAQHFRNALRSAGWPGSRSLTALEFETARAWDSTLDLLSTLDFRARRVSATQALQHLERLARSARVHIPGTAAPIQVMRPAEAEGTVFDAVVLLRAT
ncbi:MAG TPA: hypothetical protein VM865_05120, partial [Acidobacteriaceae bacterium]|nr:hypothetical protein [Acidobacteriaceae bacterium]